MLWVSIMFLDPIFGLGLSVILHLIFYNSITFISLKNCFKYI
ncbi:hypothetical protein [Plasmodium yoelii yoelii]|uniref:Uncharacterized protein n=1 Tax=Plasmodium yoelii yoelii TaxID=73239 RepID=Q7RHG5_PLAYO|nr:hypothetical protein [Plasmodium yoelii yoelii]